jgi:aminoglycoside phosphotransferase (APT) family kinase protein
MQTDKPGEIRKGEELPVESLEGYLKDKVPGLSGVMKIKQFPGGHSNLTYLISFGDREMVMRRPPFGSKVKSAHDVGREYRMLSALSPVFPCAPRPILQTEDVSVIGCPFFIMEKLKGIVIRGEIPDGMVLTPEHAEKMCRNLIKTQCTLHMIDYQGIGLKNFGKPLGYMKRQVEGWSNRYEGSKTPDAPDCSGIMVWLAHHLPPECDRPGIVHGDFKFDNVLVGENEPTEIVGVLDWEMATIGDPLADLSYTLLSWPEKNDPGMTAFAGFPPILRDAVCREEMVEYYEHLSGRRIEHLPFYFSFNLFRLGVILQQIYYRYYHGITKDERFSAFKDTIMLLMQAAGAGIDKSASSF